MTEVDDIELADRHKFIISLEGARRQFEEDPRLGAAFAVDATVAYLDGRVEARLLVPLMQLCGALVDAAMGVSNNIIEVQPYPAKRYHSPLQEDLAMAAASAAVTLYKEAGENLTAAAALVVRKLNNSFAAKTVLNFRKQLTRGESNVRPEAKSNYEFLCRHLKNDPRISARSRADSVLRLARQ